MAVDDRRRETVAIILAVGVATGLNLITLAALIDAVWSSDPGLSENATQILTGAFGGVLGVLGAYVGYRAGATSRVDDEAAAKVGRPPGELGDPVDVGDRPTPLGPAPGRLEQ